MAWFERDPTALLTLEQTLRQWYPTMHARVVDGTAVVKGTYAVVHKGQEIDRYGLRVDLPDDYPHSLPSVWETAERIPKIVDRHVFPATGALCLGVPIALWISLSGDFTIERVLDMPVRNFLIGNSMVEAGEKWPHGEWAHGADGMIEFFMETIGTSDLMKITEFLLAIIKGTIRGHWRCPCGSGAIIRKCHRVAIERLRQVPEPVLVQSGMLMLDLVKRRAEVV